MMRESILFRDAVEELLFAQRNAMSTRLLSAVAQTALMRALRSGPAASKPGARFLAAVELLRDDAKGRGIAADELATWFEPQSENVRATLWHLRHPDAAVPRITLVSRQIQPAAREGVTGIPP